MLIYFNNHVLISFFKHEPCADLGLENGIDIQNLDEDSNINSDVGSSSVHPHPVSANMNFMRKKGRKFKDEESRRKWEDIMTLKRRKLFTNIVKKEIGKQHRAKTNKHKETLIQCKRVALQCQKAARQKAVSIVFYALCMFLQHFSHSFSQHVQLKNNHGE